MVFCTLVLQFYWNNGQNKQRRWHIFEEKIKGKEKSVTIMISVDGKKTVAPVKLKLDGESFG